MNLFNVVSSLLIWFSNYYLFMAKLVHIHLALCQSTILKTIWMCLFGSCLYGLEFSQHDRHVHSTFYLLFESLKSNHSNLTFLSLDATIINKELPVIYTDVVQASVITLGHRLFIL